MSDQDQREGSERFLSIPLLEEPVVKTGINDSQDDIDDNSQSIEL